MRRVASRYPCWPVATSAAQPAALSAPGRLPANVGLDDLLQAGLIGLNEALTRFEEGRGSTFETYAARRIEARFSIRPALDRPAVSNEEIAAFDFSQLRHPVQPRDAARENDLRSIRGEMDRIHLARQ